MEIGDLASLYINVPLNSESLALARCLSYLQSSQIEEVNYKVILKAKNSFFGAFFHILHVMITSWFDGAL